MIGRTISRVASLTLALGLVTLMGCENGNLFGKLHKSGDSNDVVVLQSDAQIALEHGDFTKALALYEQILGQDPDNSNALNGAAIAAVAAAGLNFGQILANITVQNAAPAFGSLSEVIASARRGFSSQAAANSVLAGVDLEQLDAVLDLAICRLTRIAAGFGDGVIKKDEASVLINLGCLRLVRGVLRPIRANFFDLINDHGNYSVVALTDFNTVCGNPANDALLFQTAGDLIAAYALFVRAESVLGASTNSIIVKLRQEMEDAIDEALDGDTVNDLPANCVVKLNSGGISQGTFRSIQAAFDPQSGC